MPRPDPSSIIEFSSKSLLGFIYICDIFCFMRYQGHPLETLKKMGLLTLLIICESGCQINSSKIETPPMIVATTTQVGDLANQLLETTNIPVKTLMSSGVDPHMYKPRPSDLVDLMQAQLVLAHGDMFEGKLYEALVSLKARNTKPVYFISDYISANLKIVQGVHAENPKVVDPHYWFDVDMWLQGAAKMAQILGESLGEPAKTKIQSNFEVYKRDLLDAAKQSKEFLEKVPKSQRYLITSHDAFQYWGRFYGFNVAGLQGLSTLAEAGLGDMSRLASQVKNYQVPAVFVETSVSQSAIKKLSALAGVQIGAPLFSDSLGDNSQKTLAGVHLYNAASIAESLKSKSSAKGDTQ
jgi:manganese/zinc/iron transport system substrate-binding protein